VDLRFYGDLARFWPLISPVEDYEEEAHEFCRLLRAERPQAATLLELGSGGGHNAFYLKRDFVLTLSDVSPAMLQVSARLNPECEHHLGDMRTLALGRRFDLVFIHDAIDYMSTAADLRAAATTAYRHLAPGGLALLVPDTLAGEYEPSTDCDGHDGEDGSAVRLLEWSYDPDPSDGCVTTEYAFVLREADGRVWTHHETHHTGLFPRATWLQILESVGFAVTTQLEQTTEDRRPRTLFLATRPVG